MLRLASIVVVVLLAGCQSAAPAPAATAATSPTATAAASAVPYRPPFTVVLASSQAGLDLTDGRDHVSAAEAAQSQSNQALALSMYRAWQWVDEATRQFSNPPQRLDEQLLLTTREEGARLAFAFWAQDADRAPLKHVDCSAVRGLDECAEGRAGTLWQLVGRVGPYAFRMVGVSVDLEKEAALQAAILRRP